MNSLLLAASIFGLLLLLPVKSLASEETIKLTFLGTGAPRPSLDRYGPSILLEAGDQRVLVDAGPGMRERLFEAGGFELLTDIDFILLTHLHFDHTISVPGLWLSGWLYGRKTPMTVYGPIGTSVMMDHFQAAYAWDIRYREIVGVHKKGSELIGHDIEPGVVYEKDGLKITAFDVEHMPIDVSSGKLLPLEGATVGYRIDYRSRSVLFSGDTRSTSATNIIQHGKNVDVLIHEVQVPAPGDTPEARLANVSLSVHSTPDQVAAVFRQTRPRLGVYSHIIPPELSGDQLLADTDYDGAMLVAEDLMTLTIGEEIVRGRAGGTGTDIFTEADVVDKID
jgi:ribonuclease Z